MKLKEKIKKIRWLIEHQKELEKLLETPKEDSGYSIGGVPSFQKEYVQDLLKAIEK